ncbi:hypothetical protein BGX30_009389, partial [Mortierella sp. GBA39]
VGSPRVLFNTQLTRPGTHSQEYLEEHQRRIRLLPASTKSFPRNHTSKSPLLGRSIPLSRPWLARKSKRRRLLRPVRSPSLPIPSRVTCSTQ